MGESKLSEKFKEIEERFHQKLAKNFPALNKEQIQLLHVCTHGMVTAPFLSPKESTALCDSFIKSMKCIGQQSIQKG